MNAEELATYEYQLDQVKLALQKDPTNEQYIKLHNDLSELISMTLALMEQEEQSEKKSSTSSKVDTDSPKELEESTPVSVAQVSHSNGERVWKVGDDCLARWSGDNKLYEAKIIAIGRTQTLNESAEHLFSVTFKGYNNTEMVKENDLKPLHEKKTKKKYVFDLPPSELKKQKKLKQDSTEVSKSKKISMMTSEQNSKQKSWQEFHKRATKRGIQHHLPRKSIFTSPDLPTGKLGLVRSGRPMTQFRGRGKHIFSPTEDNL